MKTVHQKSINYIKNNFVASELSNFKVKDFMFDARNDSFSNIKSSPKKINFVKHTNSLKNLKVADLLNFKVKDFAFYIIQDDYVKFTQKITEKRFDFVVAQDEDYAIVLYNLARNDYYNSMINSIPGIFQHSNYLQDIFHFVDIELKDLEFYIEENLKNKRFLTARKKTLENFESEYNFSSTNHLTTEFKINRIIAKRILLKSAKIKDFIETMKLFFIWNNAISIINNKEEFQYVINFNSSNVDKEYLNYWIDLIYEAIPAWYEIKIIF